MVLQEGRPTTPTRPKTSPGKRPLSARPGQISRPKTASPHKGAGEPVELQINERPQSARPPTSMEVVDDSLQPTNDMQPPIVTLQTP